MRDADGKLHDMAAQQTCTSRITLGEDKRPLENTVQDEKCNTDHLPINDNTWETMGGGTEAKRSRQ